MSPDRFFKFARERHTIFLKRSMGLPGPWTDDPVLRTVRFTNVFRELDRTSIVFRRLIRDPLSKDPWVVPATIIARWFNRVETLEVMAPILVEGYQKNRWIRWDELIEALETDIRAAIPNGPWVTGSYMVCSRQAGKNRPKLDKLQGMLAYSRDMLSWWTHEGQAFFAQKPTLQAAHEELMKLDGLAGFTAYEVVTDLRWTTAVNPTDRLLWAHAGPGATRGGSRVLFKEPDRMSQESFKDQERLRLLMKKLLKMSRDPRYWPQGDPDWPEWELREVEHTLCEFDKYERVRREQGSPKRRYRWEGAEALLPSGLDL